MEELIEELRKKHAAERLAIRLAEYEKCGLKKGIRVLRRSDKRMFDRGIREDRLVSAQSGWMMRGIWGRRAIEKGPFASQ